MSFFIFRAASARSSRSQSLRRGARECAHTEGLDLVIINRLAEHLIARAAGCLRAVEAGKSE